MKKSRLLICPSYYESFGMVIVEAMTCGLPVVVYDLPIYGMIYPAGMIRVEIGNIDKLAQSVSNLLLDEALRNKMADDAYALSKGFSWEKTIEDIFKRLT